MAVKTKLRIYLVGQITYFFMTRPYTKRVGPLLRAVFRIYVLCFRLRLYCLIPKWILILGTTGRRSGKQRLTALEYGIDKNATRYFLMSGWGRYSDWFQNVCANPSVQVWINGRREDGIARQASLDEIVQEMESLMTISSHAVKIWSARSGVAYDGSRASLLRMAEFFPSLLVFKQPPS